jgi:hypothetical protein
MGGGPVLAAVLALLPAGCGAISHRTALDATVGGMTGDGSAEADVDAADEVDACGPEICNGRDDDCDGVIDNGCPLDGQPLSTRQIATTSPLYGSLTETTNTKFTDLCPDGQAVIGFLGNSGSALDAVGVSCGTLLVHEDRSTVPYRYSIDVTPAMQFAPVGGTGGGQNAISSALGCALDEVVTAVQTWSEPAGGACASNGCPMASGNAAGCPAVYGLAVSCTRYTISGQPGAFAVTVAAGPTASARVGGTGRAAAPATQAAFTCDGAGALNGAKGAFGRYPANCSLTVVNGLQLTCADPVIPLR